MISIVYVCYTPSEFVYPTLGICLPYPRNLSTLPSEFVYHVPHANIANISNIAKQRPAHLKGRAVIAIMAYKERAIDPAGRHLVDVPAQSIAPLPPYAVGTTEEGDRLRGAEGAIFSRV